MTLWGSVFILTRYVKIIWLKAWPNYIVHQLPSSKGVNWSSLFYYNGLLWLPWPECYRKNKTKQNLCKVQSLVFRRYYGFSFYLLWMLTWDCHLRMKAFMGNWRCLRGYSTPMSKLWGNIYPSDSSSGHSCMRTIGWNQQNSVQPSHVVMRNHNIDVNH